MSRMRDAVVIGGGLAGAAFAAELAASGRDVVVIEREAGPHDKVCGEFLSGEAVSYLRRLGLDPVALGAVAIREVALSRGSVEARRALPFEALSLSRRRLDEALLAHAARAGAELRRGSAATGLSRVGDGWRVKLANGEEIGARHAVLATGKHDLRGERRPPGRQNDLIGLKVHVPPTARAASALEGVVALALFPGGYAGLEPIEDGLANLCLVVRERTFAAHGRDWGRLLAAVAAAAPRIGEALDGAGALHYRPLGVARIPYGLVLRSGDAVWRLGDQAAVIPSFAGEGMSLALHGAGLAARTLLAGGEAADFQRRFAADVGPQVRLATAVSRALVHEPAQAVAARAARLRPALLARLAAATRLPVRALRDAGAPVMRPRATASSASARTATQTVAASRARPPAG